MVQWGICPPMNKKLRMRRGRDGDAAQLPLVIAPRRKREPLNLYVALRGGYAFALKNKLYSLPVHMLAQTQISVLLAPI